MKQGIIIILMAMLICCNATESVPQRNLEHSTLIEVPKRISDHIHQARMTVKKYCHENPAVMEEFDLFSETLKSVFESGEGITEKDVHRIIDAVVFASNKHQLQIRRSVEKTPYIIHPIAIAHSLIVIGHVRDADILIAAVLHGTVEDTKTTFEEIQGQFGDRVTGIVREVTDDKSLPQEERRRLQVKKAPNCSGAAAQVLLVDKLYNLEDVMRNPPPEWNKERRDAYFRWAQDVIDNLPWVNAPLKEAIDDLAVEYWKEKQSRD